jgi:hypothetical protein
MLEYPFLVLAARLALIFAALIALKFFRIIGVLFPLDFLLNFQWGFMVGLLLVLDLLSKMEYMLGLV